MTAPVQHKDGNQGILNRLARIEGHVRSVQRMINEGRPCDQVLIQLAAVRSAVNAVSRLVLERHISCCVVDAVSRKDLRVVEDLNNALDKIFK